MKKKANLILALLIIGANFYYIPVTIQIIQSGGGPMGFGILVLPIVLPANLFLISAIRALRKKGETSQFLLLINSIGIIGITILTFLLFWPKQTSDASDGSIIVTKNGITDTLSVDQVIARDSISKLDKGHENDPMDQAAKVDNSVPEQNDCVFDNDIEGITAQTIEKFDSSLDYRWNPEQSKTSIIFEGDTLYLSLGGCHHFNFFAELRSPYSNLQDTTFWFKKVRWVANNFFWESIGKEYSNVIDNNQLIRIQNEKIDERSYKFPVDTTSTNLIYDGVIIQEITNGVSVIFGAYFN